MVIWFLMSKPYHCLEIGSTLIDFFAVDALLLHSPGSMGNRTYTIPLSFRKLISYLT